MTKPNESDRTPDKTEKAPEKGTETEQKTAADSQAEAPKVVAADQLKNLRSFLDRGTMTGLAGMKVKEGSEFKITGLEQYKDGDARGKALAELHEFDKKGGAQRLVEKVSDEAPAAKDADRSETTETKGEAPPESPEAKKETSPEKQAEGKPEHKEETREKPEKPAETDVEYEDGKPSKVTYPDGSSREFKYENGQLTDIFYSDASGKPYDAWHFNQDTGQWEQSKPVIKGNHYQYEPTGESFDGKVRVDEKTGDLIYEPKLPVDGDGYPEYQSGPTKVVEKADGTTVETWYAPPNDYDVIKDQHDRVTELRASNGNRMRIEYEGDEIKQIYDEKGSPMLDGSEESVKIDDKTGTVTRDLGGGESETHYVGGTSEYQHSDGSKEVHIEDGTIWKYSKDEKGRQVMTEVDTSDGRHFDVSQDKATGKDQGEYTVQSGDSLSKIAEDVLRHVGMFYLGEGKGEIPKAVLKRMADLIAQANGIKDPDKIFVGQKITIPPEVWNM